MTSAEPGRKAPYSRDIRWRVIWQRIGMNLPFKKIAENLNIAASTACAHYKRFEVSGDVSWTKPSQRELLRKLSSRDELYVIGLFFSNPSLYLHEVCREVNRVLGKHVSAPTVCRLLARYGITRKKIQQVATQRSELFRAAFIAEVSCYSRDQLVWVDETGSDKRDHIRKYGYALRGQPAVYHRFLHRGKRISAIAALACDGVLAVDFHKGTVDGDKFADFVRGSLIPHMQSYDGYASKSIVILDNCTVHHTEEVTELFHSAGIVVIFLPPYSPDFNPIEASFGYVKSYLRQHDELLQAVDNPIPIIKAAFDSITSAHAHSWIGYSGYA